MGYLVEGVAFSCGVFLASFFLAYLEFNYLINESAY